MPSGQPSTRQLVAWFLIITSLVWHTARCAMVTGKDQLTPFLSANDRSRWCTVRALVDQGTYVIDDIVQQPGWNTIDKVFHLGHDGLPHYYSSKPPLLATMIAVPYAVLQTFTGWTLAERPFLVGRLLIWLVNGTFLLILFWGVLGLAERLCQTTFGYVFTVALITWGTFLTTFSVTINNHLPAAAMTAAAARGFLQFWCGGRRDAACFALIGCTATLAAAFELPAVSFWLFVLAALLLAAPKMTLRWLVPIAAIVAGAFFVTNYQAHGTLRLAYAHRSPDADWLSGNWYHYPGSYWLEENRRGVDRGEPNVWRYGFHVLLGHHGIFSLTPVWLLSLWGLAIWAGRPAGLTISLLIVSCLLAVVVFYVFGRPLGDRNYGGMTSGFRWSFWLTPLLIVALMPVLDRYQQDGRFRFLAILLLFWSTFSAVYASWHPWQHPWLYQLFGAKLPV